MHVKALTVLHTDVSTEGIQHLLIFLEACKLQDDRRPLLLITRSMGLQGIDVSNGLESE